MKAMIMESVFLIQDCIFPEISRAAAVLDEMGLPYVDVSEPHAISRLTVTDRMHIPFVSLRNLRLLGYRKAIIPGFATTTPFQAANWLTGLGDLCLNDGVFLTLGQARRRSEAWYRSWCGERIFIRPNSGRKSFPGQDLPVEAIHFELELLARTYHIDDMEMVLIAPFVELVSEMRCVVSQDGLVSATHYCHPGDEAGPPFDVQPIVEQAVERWKPVSSYVLDLGMTVDGRVAVIEANCLATSGTYDANLRDIFRHAAAQADRETCLY